MRIYPHAQALIFRQTVAADPGTREDDVAMRWSDFDSFDNFRQINAILLGKPAPFVKECEHSSLKTVLNDFRRLRLDRAIQNSQGKIPSVENFIEEFNNSLLGFFINTDAYAPEITDALDIFAARHDALIRVGTEAAPHNNHNLTVFSAFFIGNF
jgi:hypothetical protein